MTHIVKSLEEPVYFCFIWDTSAYPQVLGVKGLVVVCIEGAPRVSPYGVAYGSVPKSQHKGYIWMIRNFTNDLYALIR